MTAGSTKALIYQQIENTKRVEAAGIEPASGSRLLQPLHAYLGKKFRANPTSPAGQGRH